MSSSFTKEHTKVTVGILSSLKIRITEKKKRDAEV